MGLFDFFKRDKGKEIFPENAEAEAKASAIRSEIKRLDLPGNIEVRVEGSKVKLSGNVPDEATRQKLMMIVGNTRHVDQVDDDAVSGGSAGVAKPRVYTVESGDTLSKISKAHYGDANQYNKIFEANRPNLKDPDAIYPGQVLVIPE